MLIYAIERDALRRIDFYANLKLSGLDIPPEFTFGRAFDGRCAADQHLARDRGNMCLHRPQRFDGVGHGANVCGRSSAATAENTYPGGGRFAREKSEIFRRSFWIDDAVAFALGETGVGHAADAKLANRSKFGKDWKQSLRAQRAICADDLDVFFFQVRGGVSGAKVAVRHAFFGVSKLRDDRQQREGPNGVDGEKNFFNVREGF